MLANKKISFKNQILPNLSKIANPIKIMLYVLKAELSIFYIPIPIDKVKRPNLAINVRVIALTLLLKSIKALVSLV